VFRLFGGGFMIMSLTFVLTTAGASATMLALVAFLYGFFQFGMYASFGAYFTELFPTELRGSGQAFAYNFGRAGSAFFVMLVPLVALSTGLSAAMGIMGAIGIGIVVLAIAFLPETAGSALHDLDAPEPIPTGGPVAPAG
jgi:MFS family permease